MTETTETSHRTATVVHYDDACGMCRRAVARLRPLLEPRGFCFEPFAEGVEPVEMKLREPDGTGRGGADAVVAMARAVWWLRPLTFFTGLPGVMSLLRRGYRNVAAHRHCLSGACGWPPPAKAAHP